MYICINNIYIYTYVCICDCYIVNVIAWRQSVNYTDFSIAETIVLLRFLKCMHYDVEKTKTLIELNYSLRNKNPNIFMDRNMEDEMTAKGLQVS